MRLWLWLWLSAGSWLRCTLGLLSRLASQASTAIRQNHRIWLALRISCLLAGQVSTASRQSRRI